MVLEELYDIGPYSLDIQQKEEVFARGLSELTKKHYYGCSEYRSILDSLRFDVDKCQASVKIPFIPVRLFKEYELLSVPKNEIVKTMTSSGTSGQAVSKIFLDKENVRDQTKTLTAIITSFIGKQRLPLLLLDSELVKKDRSMFSARGAGIIGFTPLARCGIWSG